MTVLVTPVVQSRAHLVFPVVGESSGEDLRLSKRGQQAKVLGKSASLTFDIRQQFTQEVAWWWSCGIDDGADLVVTPTASNATDQCSYTFAPIGQS